MVPRAAKPTLARALNPSLRATCRALVPAVISPPGVRRRVLRFTPPERPIRAWSLTSMTSPDESSLPGVPVRSGKAVPGVPAAERVADRLDELVPVSDEVGNRVLPDNARLVRWAAPVFLGCAVILLPWIVIAAVTLPSRQLSENYDGTWPKRSRCRRSPNFRWPRSASGWRSTARRSPSGGWCCWPAGAGVADAPTRLVGR